MSGQAESHPALTTAEAAIASALIAFFVCLGTYLLRAADSIPLKRLVSLEDQLFDRIAGRDMTPLPGARRVVFLDIDDRALKAFPGAVVGDEGTPRTLVATLLQKSIKNNAAVVYVDLDLRAASLQGDAMIKTAIKSAGNTRILLPAFFGAGLPQPCEAQTAKTALLEFNNRFSDLSVEMVHPLVSIGPFSTIEAACSAYLVELADGDHACRKAAMVVATEGKEEAADHQSGRYQPCAPRLDVINWVVGPDINIMHPPSTPSSPAPDPIFAHIWAGWLMQDEVPHPRRAEKAGNVASAEPNLSLLQGAIVIIGSTHRYSSDAQPTPIGTMPGALVQANLALTLQAKRNGSFATWASILIDLGLLLLGGLFSFFIYQLVPGRGWRSVADAVCSMLVGAAFFLLSISLASSQLNGWRFGILACLVAAVVTSMISIVPVVAEGGAVWIVKHWKIGRRALERTLLLILPVLLFFAFSPRVAHGEEKVCPVDLLVAQVIAIEGDSSKVNIIRDGVGINAPKTLPYCLLYGDEVRVAAGARVTLALPGNDRKRLGSPNDPQWLAPHAHTASSTSVADIVIAAKSILTAMTQPVAYLATPALGRGSAQCPAERPATQSRLAPVAAVGYVRQTVGADLERLGVAWKPLRWPGRVQVRLIGADGAVVAQRDTCEDTHLDLPVPHGALTAGAHLSLDVRDGPDSSFHYDIDVVEPRSLPQPPGAPSVDWLIAAWRLGAAPAETHLDALSRLELAPSESLAAHRLMEAVWHDVRF